MNAVEFYEEVLSSKIFKEWHYFRYHFECFQYGRFNWLANDIAKACLLCEDVVPGFSKLFIEKLASIGGRDRFEPHYEQLIQLLAELHILTQVYTFSQQMNADYFSEEQNASKSKFPEVIVKVRNCHIGVEVKSPQFFKHVNMRATRPYQVPARSMPVEALSRIADGMENVTLPRDNPIKDFLVSADDKFNEVKSRFSNFYGILVIVWDDFIYEPISALLSQQSGLLTPSTFFKDTNGNPVTYLNIDGIFIIRHLHQIVASTREEPLADSCQWTFDYGQPDIFPWKAFVPTPWGKRIPTKIIECFQGRLLSPMLGAEYVPNDIIMWVNR